MKKRAVTLFICAFSMMLLLAPKHMAALGLPACFADNSCTEYEECEYLNVDRNWSQNTGYHEDCSGLPGDPNNKDIKSLAMAGIAFLSLGILMWIYFHKKQPRKIKKKSSRTKQ